MSEGRSPLTGRMRKDIAKHIESNIMFFRPQLTFSTLWARTLVIAHASRGARRAVHVACECAESLGTMTAGGPRRSRVQDSVPGCLLLL